MHKSQKVGFVVNYYWRPTYPKSVRSSATLAIHMLRNCTFIDQIVLVDGSSNPDFEIKDICEQSEIIYIHMGKELKLAEGFNVGWKRLDTYYVGLMASDVFPFPETIAALLDAISLPDIGSVSPFLDFCDYPGQMAAYVRKPVSCEPTSLTLNLNIFKRSVLESINGIDENYTGGFNDVIMLMKIRQKGFRVLLIGNTRVTHIGGITVANGTNFLLSEDNVQFTQEFPQVRTNHGKWNIKRWQWPLATTRMISFLWWIAQNFPSYRVRRFLQWTTIWLEPEFTRYPAKYGRRTF